MCVGVWGRALQIHGLHPRGWDSQLVGVCGCYPACAHALARLAMYPPSQWGDMPLHYIEMFKVEELMTEIDYETCKQLTLDYLEQATLRQLPIQSQIIGHEDYHLLTRKYGRDETGNNQVGDFITTDREQWDQFCQKIYELSQSRIGSKQCDMTLMRCVDEIGVFPFTVDQKESIVKRFTEYISDLATSKRFAVIPLYNLVYRLDPKIEKVELGETFLYPPKRFSNITIISKSTKDKLLELPSVGLWVYGDADYVEKRIESAVADAFRILRFVTIWKITDGFNRTDAEHISMWRGINARNILILNESKTEGSESFLKTPRFALMPEDWTWAVEVAGIEAINFHQRNRYNNPISKRIMFALEMHDEALISNTLILRIYRFVVSIEWAIPLNTQDDNLFHKIVPEMINYNQVYFRFIKERKHTDQLDPRTWENTIQPILSKTDKLYGRRSKIIHGNIFDKDFELSDEDANILQELAFNILSMISKLAFERGWQSQKDVKDWYKKEVSKSNTE